MPVVIWQTAAALQRTAGKSLDKPGTAISRAAPSALSHGAASSPNILTIITFTASGAAVTGCAAAPVPGAVSIASTMHPSSHARRQHAEAAVCARGNSLEFIAFIPRAPVLA